MFAPKRLTAALAATALLGLTACGGNGDAEAIPEDQTSFRIGVANLHEGHQQLEEIAEEELGYEIELVNFTDYNQPNPALSNGDIDVNWFQHIAYLAEHNNSSGDNLQPIGATEIVPLTLYSNEYSDVSDFQDGDTVAIPNDPVNQGRAINVLVAAGLLELAEETAQPEPRHIDEAASTVSVQTLDAAQTVNALQSAQGAVINNNFAQDADLDPNEDGLFADDPNDPSAFPYVNAFVAREADVDNEALREIAALYHDQRVLDIIDERSAGTSVPAGDVTAEELQEALTDYQEALRQAE